MKPLLAHVLALVALAAIPAAQNGSPLRIQTKDPHIAARIMDRFGGLGDLPDIGPHGHYLLSLDDGGKIQVKAGQGEAAMLRLVARPAALMELFADDVARAKGMIQGFGVMAMAQSGIKAQVAIKMVRAVFDFPDQIATLRFTLSGDAERPEEGYKMHTSLTPVAGTWFAEFVGALTPLSQGVPVLQDPQSMLDLAISVDSSRLAAAIDPFVELFSSVGAKTKADRVTFAGLMRRAWATYDGSGSMVWNPDGGGLRYLAGLRDGKGMKALIADADYRRLLKAQQSMNPQAEVEIDYDAFEHRGVKAIRSTATIEGPAANMPNPMFKEGKMEILFGIADDYMAMGMSCSEGDFKALLDQILDQRIQRKPLPAGSILKGRIKLADMADVMTGGMVPLERVPESMELLLGVANGSLEVTVEIR